MPYTDIVVQLDADASVVRDRVAADIAARANGHLTGLYLKTTLINQYNNIGCLGYLPPVDLDALIREHDQSQDAAASRAGGMLAKAAADAKVACDWRVISGDAPADLVAQARHADLVVMSAPSASPAYSVNASVVDVTLGGGGPVLVVPETAKKVRVGERVLVAWNGSRESGRALRDALPLMAAGAVVEVRMARPKDAAGDEPEALRQHLERHGFTANVVTIVDEGQSIAEWLQSEAATTGCDLIVMGLYGHTRMREFVLGGVSRGMLLAPSLPLLVSH